MSIFIKICGVTNLKDAKASLRKGANAIGFIQSKKSERFVSLETLNVIKDAIGIDFLTIPVFYPVIVDAGIDPVWFGIFAVIVVEFGLISPPVGMNLFVIKGVMQKTPLQTIWFGTVPFLITDVIRLALIIAFPAICLYLPSLMTP